MALIPLFNFILLLPVLVTQPWLFSALIPLQHFNPPFFLFSPCSGAVSLLFLASVDIYVSPTSDVIAFLSVSAAAISVNAAATFSSLFLLFPHHSSIFKSPLHYPLMVLFLAGLQGGTLALFGKR